MRMVWNGSKVFTKSGMTKKDLCLSKSGRLMTKKQFKHGQRMKTGSWMKAVAKARKELGITGFVPLNRGPQGQALYKLAKSSCRRLPGSTTGCPDGLGSPYA